MELIIGGRAQGKLAIAQTEYPSYKVLDGASVSVLMPASEIYDEGEKIILDHAHILIRRMLEAGMGQEQIEKEFTELQKCCDDIVVISDEIGSGIVPMDPFERQWREVTGRVLTVIAASSDRVERVTCGLVQVLK